MPSANRQSSLRFMQYLDQSDSRLKLALQVTNSGMWEWNLQTGQVCWSTNFEQMLGVVPGTLAGNYRSVLEQIVPADRRSFNKAIARALRKQGDYCVEFRIYCPGGKIRWLLTQGKVECDDSNKPVKMIGLCRDITQDKQAEAAQRQDGETETAIAFQERIAAAPQQASEAREVRRKERAATLDPGLERFQGRIQQLGDGSDTGTGRRGDTGKIEETLLSTNLPQPLDVPSCQLACVSTLARNIALTKQAETMLARSDAKWRALVQHSFDLVAILSADGTILYESPSIQRILGYSPEEVVGQHSLHYIAPQDAEVIKKTLENLLVVGHGATLPSIVFRAFCKDGSWCWLEATGTNLLADAAVGGIVINARDVTERFQVQEVLQPSEVPFRAIFENAALGIALSDPSGKLIASNRALHKLLGYSEQELRQRTFAHPEDIAADSNLFQELLAGTRSSYQLEKRYFHKNGNLVWGRVSVSLVRDRTGSPLFAVSMVEDITAAKQTEAQLLRISKAVENASDAIAIADTLLVEFTYINPAFCQMFGYTLEQLNAAGGFAILFPDPKVVHEVLAIAVSGQSWQGEVEMVSRRGKTKQIALRTDAIKDEKGEVVGAIAIHSDITERKQADKALQLSEARANIKAKELEQALRDLQDTQAQLVQTEKMSSLGQLVAGVAHEINNPVNFITGNISYACDYIEDLLRVVNLYQQHYPQPVEAIQAELEEIDLDFLIKDFPRLLNSMKVGADRINQIVLSLRNFSRNDKGEMKLADIHEGIDNTLMILQNRLKAKGVSPDIEIIKEYGTLPLVECYVGQLNQVFMNLISNAIDALESGREEAQEKLNFGTNRQSNHPHIPLPSIEIRTEVRGNNWVAIYIKDNGPGMTDEVRQKLFNPFFTTKPMGKGTGLGLSISYQIVVEKHGGQLQCFSVLGEGTEFIIEIPIRHSFEATA